MEVCPLPLLKILGRPLHQASDYLKLFSEYPEYFCFFISFLFVLYEDAG